MGTSSLETPPGRDRYLLCAPLPGGQGRISRGGRWMTGVTRETLQPHLRAIRYRQKGDRGARQAYIIHRAETVTFSVPLFQAAREEHRDLEAVDG